MPMWASLCLGGRASSACGFLPIQETTTTTRAPFSLSLSDGTEDEREGSARSVMTPQQEKSARERERDRSRPLPFPFVLPQMERRKEIVQKEGGKLSWHRRKQRERERTNVGLYGHQHFFADKERTWFIILPYYNWRGSHNSSKTLNGNVSHCWKFPFNKFNKILKSLLISLAYY